MRGDRAGITLSYGGGGGEGGGGTVSGNPMTTDPRRRSTAEPLERQNPLISVDPLQIIMKIPDSSSVVKVFFLLNERLVPVKIDDNDHPFVEGVLGQPPPPRPKKSPLPNTH